MAVTINTLKYIPDLPAAGALSSADLLHISQGNTDKQLTFTALQRYMADIIHPVGSLIYFGVKGKDPNLLFPGQTWVRYQAGRSIRVCLDNESNLGQVSGTDTITLTAAQMPAHTHAAAGLAMSSAGDHYHTGNTSTVGDHTHGAWTDVQGNHNHPGRFYVSNTSLDGGASNRRSWEVGRGYNGEDLIGYAGAHSHNVGMNGAGSHYHSFTTNTTGNHVHNISGNVASSGSNGSIYIVPSTISVACWIRNA